MKISQLTTSRFHHFHLARQLERAGMLGEIFSAYPRFKLRDETGIPAERIRTFPWLHAGYMAALRYGYTTDALSREWEWWVRQSVDWYASRKLGRTDGLIAISGSGLRSGKVMQARGGFYVCDRASSHIRYQDEILRGEYCRWGLEWKGVDPRVIAKEEAEYAQADRITIPSKFVYDSFLDKGVPPEKIVKIPFGARLERFHPAGEPVPGEFTVLYVGQVSVRKGFLDLAQAFSKVKHPSKRLLVAGLVHREMRPILDRHNLAGVEFLGTVDNARLPELYSRAQVLVLPSLEEGLSYVQGEALACGCPVISTPNSGAEDLFTDGIEGFIVPIRSPEAILEKLERIAQDPAKGRTMGAAGIEKVKELGGWGAYGDAMIRLFQALAGSSARGGTS